MSCLSFWVPRAVGPLHPPVIQMLGGNEFRLRQGFRLWRKRLYAAKAAPARRPVVWCSYTFSRFQNIDFNRPIQKERHDQRSCLSFWVPAAKGGWNPSGFQCSGRRSHPCAKVLAYGQNACAAHSRRGPEGPFSSSSAAVPPIQNIDFNRPFHKRNLLLIEFKSGFLSVLRQFFFQKQ